MLLLFTIAEENNYKQKKNFLNLTVRQRKNTNEEIKVVKESLLWEISYKYPRKNLIKII